MAILDRDGMVADCRLYAQDDNAAGAAATFVTNTSLIANDTATFDGYTLGQAVKALRNITDAGGHAGWGPHRGGDWN